jgi:hypothetical protein
VAGYLVALLREPRVGAAASVGAVSLLVVLPTLTYAGVTFAPDDRAAFAEAQRILAEVRIPHHADVRRWLDPIAGLQVAWVVLAIALVRGTVLAPLLAIPAVVSAALTLVQVATGSHALALLFPWRVSAVLVPVATAVVFARLAAAAAGGLGRWPVAVYLVGLVVLYVTLGGREIAFDQGYRMNETELPVLEFVRGHKQPGDVYLIPVAVPKLGGGARGTPSTTFTPPPRSRPGATLIPVDMQRFRLFTGAPLYVDFKSIPYKDTEVLEWYRRVQLAQGWYEAKDWGRVRPELVREGVTHVVTTADRDPGGGQALERVYEDETYRVYRVRP